MVLPLYRVQGIQPAGYGGVGTDLIRMTLADTARIRYELRRAFAAACQAGQNNIFAGNGGTRIGSAVDTMSTQRTNSDRTRFPGFPGIGTSTVTRNFGMNNFSPANPTNFANTYLYWREENNDVDNMVESGILRQGDLEIINAQIIAPCRVEMLGGSGATRDEVGTYRVSTRSPGAGWVDQGRWFLDTRFTDNIDYRLWLRTTAATPAGPRAVTMPTAGNAVLQGHNPNDPFIQQILLPLLQRVAPTYTVENNRAGTRGIFTDTRLTQTSNDTAPRTGFSPGQSPTGLGDDYRSISTPTGNAMTINTYTLGIA